MSHDQGLELPEELWHYYRNKRLQEDFGAQEGTCYGVVTGIS
jgi:hypothetical protein